MIYLAVQVCALVRLLWIRYPYPWFLAALALHAAQTWNVQHATRAPDWTRTHWIAPEVVLVLLTAAATWEAIERERRTMPAFLQFQLRVASSLIPVSLVGLGIRFVAPIKWDLVFVFNGPRWIEVFSKGDLEAGFNAARSWAWVLLALALLIARGLVLTRSSKAGLDTWKHSALLLVVLLVHATLSWYVGETEERKRELRLYSRLTIGACCVLWAVTSRREKPPVALGSPAKLS